jgi:hypothetical protein
VYDNFFHRFAILGDDDDGGAAASKAFCYTMGEEKLHNTIIIIIR